MDPLHIPAEMIERLLLSLVLSGLIGLQRDWTGHAAGLRTNMLISMSACLFAMLSLNAFGEYDSRVVSQIVTGVGFLGAGAVLRHNDRVSGLTTASTIWLMAAVGTTVGMGFYGIAIFATLFALIALHCLAPVSSWLEAHRCPRCRHAEESIEQRAERPKRRARPKAPRAAERFRSYRLSS